MAETNSDDKMILKRTYRIPPDHTDTHALRGLTDLYCGETLLKRLHEAVLAGGEITVYGDYDADGIIAVYILYSALNRIAKGRVHWFINNRHDDGYNITAESMEKCLRQYPGTKTVITCDNGINAAEAVDRAMERGILVLVTDHHVQTRPLRDDCPAVDEKSIRQVSLDRAAGVTPDECCGAELARRVAEALFDEMGLSDKHRDFLDGLYAYAGLATITDVVPMNPPNHAVARRGLQLLQKEEGFWGLLKEEFIPATKRIHWDTVGFYYGPLLNASSRMTGEATHAVQMLLSYDDGDEAACRNAIRALIALNVKRREVAAHDDAIANEIIETQHLESAPFILVWSGQFSEGVNGLTASHITERYRVPCAVLAPTKRDPDVYKGSARSVEGANLIEVLQKHAGLIQAGGHALAAGLSVRKEDLETVRALLTEDLKGFQAPPEAGPDFFYQADRLTRADADFHEKLIEAYEPFGPGFEEPRIAFTGRVGNLWKNKGKNTDELVHAVFPMGNSADGYPVKANWWNHLREAEQWYEKGKTLYCSGKIAYDEYTNREGKEYKSIQITIGRLLN
ncbi:MAG: DHH family phosphoesterase [Lachnospiraceae bacterium]|nr:DHH family phosphoesterase [Lachnospiraceae bacterium]